MNNGLQGRYQPQMAAWNQARAFAGELIEAFFAGDESLTAVVDRWHENRPVLPSASELKDIINDVLFSSGEERVNRVAYHCMRQDGWY